MLALLVAAAGALGASLAAFAVGALTPSASQSAHETIRLLVFAVVGGLSGFVTTGWLRPEASTRDRLTAALVLAVAFAIGVGAGDGLQPLGRSLRQQGALGTSPVFFAAALGAMVVAQLAVEPGDAEGVALARRTWGLSAAAPNDIADALVVRARAAWTDVGAVLRSPPPRATV